jgi:NOL1/NOP2/fmu family ribosome biogenesis protein
LTPEADAFFAHMKTSIDTNRLEEHEGKLYLPPCDMADVRGLRILRSGVYLGENKKKRFEPSQPYAVSLNQDTCALAVSLPADDARVIRYLKGETIALDGPEGMVLVCVDGFGLGWGKIHNGMCKNKYSAGWRLG